MWSSRSASARVAVDGEMWSWRAAEANPPVIRDRLKNSHGRKLVHAAIVNSAMINCQFR